ncbi:hypothetical protein QUV83_10220 [Cellulomonas cellasea]|uniref:hypothetical protein n=1 Tax=Cellulomonas cellasea TaxID=43670 RepID=UPI0025A4063F|nr:hypothetical protein [Cellulomonas cellasea]MDM8085140.1 hypothetical protein [Cellulomonas cellasea]
MTGARREAGRWVVRPRVEFVGDATIRLEQVDHGPEPFSMDLVDDLFAVGLLAPSEEPEPQHVGASSSFTQVVLSGDARFLVGEVDLGRELGMEILSRGLHHTVQAARGESRAVRDTGRSGPESDPPPEDTELADEAEIVMPDNNACDGRGDDDAGAD